MARADLITALRRQAQRGPVRLHELEPQLRRQVLRVFGSMADARRAARLDALPRRTRWSNARIIEAMAGLHRAGQHMSQNAVIDAGHRALVLAAIDAFGSWTAARTRARLPPLVRRAVTPGPAWDDALVIAEIHRRQRRRESLAVTKVPRSLSSAANRHFGSWRQAIEAAGFDYADVALSRRFDDEELLDWLRRLARKRPRMLLHELDTLGGHREACKRRWGSLEDAARAAGLVGWPIRTRFAALSTAKVIRGLRARARAGQPLSLIAVRRDPSAAALRHSALRHFATWDEAIKAAGLPPQRLRRRPA